MEKLRRIISGKNIDSTMESEFKSKTFQIPKQFNAPISIVWEITGKCNSNCLYCSGGFPKKLNELSTEEKLKLAQELCDMNIFQVSISGGEPLLSPDLVDIVKIFEKKEIPVMVCTTGVKVNFEIVDQLLEFSNVSYNVSIDSISSESNDKVRGRRGALVEALNLIKYIEKNGSNRTFISVETVVTNENIDQIDDLVKVIWEKTKVMEHRIQSVISMNKETYRYNLNLSPTKLENYVLNLYEKIAEYEKIPYDFEEIPLIVRFVDQSKSVITGIETGRNWGGIISPDGHYLVNGYIPFEFGNILEFNNFQEAWLGKYVNSWKNSQIIEELSDVNNIFDLERIQRKYNYKKIKI